MHHDLRFLGQYVGVVHGALVRRPIYISYGLTPVCNFKCIGCDVWRTNYSEEMVAPVAISQIESLSTNLAQIGTCIITINGGEPTLVPNLTEIVRELSRKHLVHLISNGSHLDRDRLRELFRAGLHGLAISIDSFDERQHDTIRQVRGSYRQAYDVLRMAAQERCSPFQRVHLNMIYMDHNADSVERWLAELEGTGITFACQPYYVHGHGETTTTSKLVPAIDPTSWLLKLKQRYSHFQLSTSFIVNMERGMRGKLTDCSAGTMFFWVDHRGMIARCSLFGRETIPQTSLFDPGFSWQQTKLLLRHEAQKARQCGACYCVSRGEMDALEKDSWRTQAAAWLPRLLGGRARS